LYKVEFSSGNANAEIPLKPLKVAVLASGGGSNLAALLEAIHAGRLAAEIVLVVSNNADSGALAKAERAGIPARHLSLKKMGSQDALDRALLDAFRQHQVDVIALAGYMKKIGADIIGAYRNRIVNIHPALLPAFGGKGMYGMNVHRAVLDYGCKLTGVTVHLVTEEYDAGPPILQETVPVLQGDTPESLAARVLKVEHTVYAQALQMFAEGRIEVQDRKVVIREA